MGVSFKKYAKLKKIQNCTQIRQETCLIWSFSGKMDPWQDVTHLSWSCLMAEIRHKKTLLAHLTSTKISDLVHQQQLWHYREVLLVLEREEECRLMVAVMLRPQAA